jgi:hypothetical protein
MLGGKELIAALLLPADAFSGHSLLSCAIENGKLSPPWNYPIQ